jgi:hypothetical protein
LGIYDAPELQNTGDASPTDGPGLGWSVLEFDSNFPYAEGSGVEIPKGGFGCSEVMRDQVSREGYIKDNPGSVINYPGGGHYMPTGYAPNLPKYW